MKIKGKILLHKPLYKADLGENGFLSSEAFAFFDDKLYLNLSANFFSESKTPFLIPFKRTSMEADGFEIDFESAGVAFVSSLVEPQKTQGWIGPYDFEKSYFTWAGFCRKLSIEELYNLYLKFLNSGEYSDAEVVFSVYKEKFSFYIESLSLDSLNEEKDDVLLGKEEFNRYCDEFEEDERDEKYFRLLFKIIDFKINLIESKIKSFSKKVTLEEMSKGDLYNLLEDAIINGDFESAAIIRDLLATNKV